MAKKVTTTLIDDIDGSEATETVSFALDRVEYQIDLSEKNAAALREHMREFIDHGRRLGRAGKFGAVARLSGGGAAGASPDRELNQEIREWARKKGLKISDRGRIPVNISTQFHEDRKTA